MKVIFAFVSIIFLVSNAYSQKSSISGFISSDSSSEKIIGSYIVDLQSKAWTMTDEHGFFKLTLTNGIKRLLVTHACFQKDTIKIELLKDTVVTIKLKPFQIDEIVVSSEIPIYKQTMMGKTILLPSVMSKMPSFMGETDVMKSLTVIPGVSGDRKGVSNIYVRGGNRHNNLILIDDAPIYSSNHMFGFVSIFNNDIIKNVDFYKSSFPARYGGRTSSVIDIRTKEGDKKDKKGQFELNPINAKFVIEGPLGNEKTSYIFAARLCNSAILSLLTRMNQDPMTHTTIDATYLDCNAKLTHYYSNENKTYLNFYSGTDFYHYNDIANSGSSNNIEEENKSKINYIQNNRIVTLGHQVRLNSAFSTNFGITFSQYGSKVTAIDKSITEQDTILAKTITQGSIKDISIFINSEYVKVSQHQFRYGFRYNRFKVIPILMNIHNTQNQQVSDTIFGRNDTRNPLEYSIYGEDEIALRTNISANIGMRFCLLKTNAKSFLLPEPRLSFRWLVGEKTAIKAGYSIMNQQLHLLTNNTMGIGSEIWITSDTSFVPEHSWIGSIGISGEQGKLQYGIETYYKKMKNLLYYSYTELEPSSLSDFSKQINKNGNGRSYGIETTLTLNTKNVVTNIGYTLSWSEHRFATIDNNRYFYSNQDRRHNLCITNSIFLKNRQTIGMVFTLSSGSPFTMPVAYVKNNEFSDGYYVYGGINNYRMPIYHRLDINYRKEWEGKKKHRQKYLTINIYNVYARANADYMYFNGKQVKKVTLIKFLPTIGYGIHF